jgi:hypothetical protein
LNTVDVTDDPQWYYEQGFSDLITPNEKDDVHPARKVLTGRWRIFCCPTLIDQIVERVLFTDAINAVKSDYPNSGATIGIGFTDEQTSEFCNKLVTTCNMDHTKYSDVEKWESSLGRDYIKIAGDSVNDNMTNKENTKHMNAIRIHAMKITNPLYVVADKNNYYLWVRGQPGGMISGSFVTTLYNTLARLDVSYVAGADTATAAGDDCIEEVTRTLEQHIIAYDELGYKLRDLIKAPKGTVKFCSHTMKEVTPGNWQSTLDTWPKLLFNTLSKKVTPERFSGFVYELINSPNREELIKAVQTYGTFSDVA